VKSLWLKSYGWDDRISAEESEEFLKIVFSFAESRKISISRCYYSSYDDILKMVLHVFCDASEQAYAAPIRDLIGYG